MNTLRIVLVCALAAATAAGSRAQAKPTAVMTSRGGFFALSVADMKASGAWYVEKPAWPSRWRRRRLPAIQV